MEFDARHQGAAGFANASALDHVAAFTYWALAIHLGKLKEARFAMNPTTTTSSKSSQISGMPNASCRHSEQLEIQEPPARQVIWSWSTKYSRALVKA
jgi:hypothetical protein